MSKINVVIGASTPGVVINSVIFRRLVACKLFELALNIFVPLHTGGIARESARESPGSADCPLNQSRGLIRYPSSVYPSLAFNTAALAVLSAVLNTKASVLNTLTTRRHTVNSFIFPWVMVDVKSVRWDSGQAKLARSWEEREKKKGP